MTVESLEVGKIYQAFENPDWLGLGRHVLFKFIDLKDMGDNDWAYIGELSDGRMATLMTYKWIIQEGSELLWALS